MFVLSPTYAQEQIRFARTPDISPDGKLIAFSYMGDIWTVESIGGIARPVTMHEAHDISPVFSPDGKWLAFSSNRHGNYDVFVTSVHGGKPRRLTFDSAADTVNSWTPDGKAILFTSNRSTGFPPSLDLYLVPIEAGKGRRISAAEGKDGAFSPDGKQIAYVHGPGTWYRKGYRGSSNDDIWLADADGTNNRQITAFNGQDGSPMWSANGQALFFVSEQFATPANVVRLELSGKKEPQLVTTHKDDAVRQAHLSRNGEWIVYECGADLWIASTKAGIPPRRLAIEINADDKANTEKIITFTKNVTEFAHSPDEKHVAFVAHGEVFLVPATGGKATRLTDHPAFDHGLAWAPDGKKILFASDRHPQGHEDLFLLEPDDPEHSELVKAHRFKVKQLTDTPEAEIGASFSPDGRRIAFIRAGRLWTMRSDDSNAKPLVNDVQVFDYDWSPDSKSIVFARADGSFASELYIIPAIGGEARNITRYATYNGDVTWSGNGQKLSFVSQRRRGSSLYVLSLQKPAVPGASSSSQIDWDDIHLRVEQPAPLPVEEGTISRDGNRVAFRSTANNGDDLWVATVTGGRLTRLTTGNVRPQSIRWSKLMPDTIYFRDGNGAIRMARAGAMEGLSMLSRSGMAEPLTLNFSAKMTIRRDEEFGEMFEQSWRALREHFYDEKFHGADWYGVRAKYRPLLQHVAAKEDFYTLITLMLGELNASHLGIAGPVAAPEQLTADLGLLFNDSYAGPGLKIQEVLKRGPADKRGLKINVGDVIQSIDGIELTDRVELSKLLNDKAGETVVLNISSKPSDAKSWRRVEIQAVARPRIHELMYDRWVERNAQRVAELSKGKLGYIHIPSMDEAGLDRFLRALYSDAFAKDAIVLDVRYNGGGFTHDQVLNYLGAKAHTIFRHRLGGEGGVLRSYDRKWTKPLVLLINNRSYSDAEIFPNAFRTLGLGKLVGQPTGGHVIGTSTIRLIDGSMFRIPRLGVYTAAGVKMENEGVQPDVVVLDHPDKLAKGIDAQLEKAVAVLLEDLSNRKKSGTQVARQPENGKSTEKPPNSSGK